MKLGLRATTRVLSCYEAGRDGFWIHRQLVGLGIENLVVDAASIEVDRRQKRAKTDRIDATKLVHQLVRHDERGDRLRVVRVPTPEQEDSRRPLRELERLKKERTQHTTRIRALLALHGIADTKLGRAFDLLVAHLRGPDGKPLPSLLRAELQREAVRLELVRKQIGELEKARSAALKSEKSAATQVAAKLMLLKAIGPNAATTFALEMFAWREFKNGRQVGASAGLTATPYDSGGSSREQGISKAGNRRVRAIAIEIAWRGTSRAASTTATTTLASTTPSSPRSQRPAISSTSGCVPGTCTGRRGGAGVRDRARRAGREAALPGRLGAHGRRLPGGEAARRAREAGHTVRRAGAQQQRARRDGEAAPAAPAREAAERAADVDLRAELPGGELVAPAPRGARGHGAARRSLPPPFWLITSWSESEMHAEDLL